MLWISLRQICLLLSINKIFNFKLWANIFIIVTKLLLFCHTEDSCAAFGRTHTPQAGALKPSQPALECRVPAQLFPVVRSHHMGITSNLFALTTSQDMTLCVWSQTHDTTGIFEPKDRVWELRRGNFPVWCGNTEEERCNLQTVKWLQFLGLAGSCVESQGCIHRKKRR